MLSDVKEAVVCFNKLKQKIHLFIYLLVLDRLFEIPAAGFQAFRGVFEMNKCFDVKIMLKCQVFLYVLFCIRYN